MLCLAIYRRGDTEDGDTEEEQEEEEEESDGNSEKVLFIIIIPSQNLYTLDNFLLCGERSAAKIQ